jgi:hypothetical protein
MLPVRASAHRSLIGAVAAGSKLDEPASATRLSHTVTAMQTKRWIVTALEASVRAGNLAGRDTSRIDDTALWSLLVGSEPADRSSASLLPAATVFRIATGRALACLVSCHRPTRRSTGGSDATTWLTAGLE